MVHRKNPPAPAQKRTVLLTGFDAFGGDALNPSWLAVQALRGRQVAGHRVVVAQLPTVFGESLTVLHALLQKHHPALVVCVGVAGGRSGLSLERVAINVDDARIADNAGAQPIDVPVIAGGPAAYFSTLPIKAMLLALQAAQVNAEVSQTAGTFVCNHVFFGLMHRLATRRELRGVRGGFIHVPALAVHGPHGQGLAGMALDEMVRGLHFALRCAVSQPNDVAHGAGQIA